MNSRLCENARLMVGLDDAKGLFYIKNSMILPFIWFYRHVPSTITSLLLDIHMYIEQSFRILVLCFQKWKQKSSVKLPDIIFIILFWERVKCWVAVTACICNPCCDSMCSLAFFIWWEFFFFKKVFCDCLLSLHKWNKTNLCCIPLGMFLNFRNVYFRN